MIGNDKRRRFLVASLGGITAIKATHGLTQEREIPSIDQTLQFLDDTGNAKLLYIRFNYVFSLGVNAVAILQGASLNNEYDLPEIPTRDEQVFEIFRLLRDIIANNENIRSSTAAALIDQNKPLHDGHIKLVNEFANAVLETGLGTESENMRSAFESITHVERIAIQNLKTDQNKGFLCRIFPFSYFCSD